MKELIGCECACDFNLPLGEWPISGYPAWVIVLDVDGNMIKLASKFGDIEKSSFWCNTSIIKTIRKS